MRRERAGSCRIYNAPNAHDRANVDHGLAHAAIISPSLVGRVMAQLNGSGYCRHGSMIDRKQFGRLGQLLGEDWEACYMEAEFGRVSNGGDFISFDRMYRWLVRHTRCDSRRKLHRYQPDLDPLRSVRPQQLALLCELDTTTDHREDIISPRRGVSLVSHLVPTPPLCRRPVLRAPISRRRNIRRLVGSQDILRYRGALWGPSATCAAVPVVAEPPSQCACWRTHPLHTVALVSPVWDTSCIVTIVKSRSRCL